MLFEMPSENTFHGYYHLEGALVGNTLRARVSQGVECPRSLITPSPILAMAAPPDSGVPSPDVGDGNACPLVYADPGCGVDVKPVCYGSGGDVPAIAVYYCNCAGKTIMAGLNGPSEPYQAKGCCPGESGFGPLGSYSCPWDGGLPYLTPTGDAGVATTDAGDGNACPLVYSAPGCGVDTKPVCSAPGGDASKIGVYYCSCAGKTIMAGEEGPSEPYQAKGCCPGDSGFGPLGSYSCPWDGGVPYITPRNDAGLD
jgi:hypothetical protein